MDAVAVTVLPDFVARLPPLSLPAGGVQVDMRIDHQWPAHRSVLALHLGWAQIRPRNSTIVCAARYDVTPVPTSSMGFTSTRSKPTTFVCSAMATSISRSSSYTSPLGSAETHPGTSDMSRTSMSMLT